MKPTTPIAKGAVILAMAALIAIGMGLPGQAETNRVSASIYDATGAAVGSVKLNGESGGGVRVRVEVTGLPPGFHGFHIHSVGVCEAPFTTAGGHWNPAGQTHPSHAGDQPVLMVNADGTAEASFVSDRYEIAHLLDADGNAFIIHANPDNYANVYRYGTPDATTLATGDAGGRIACGVIQPGG
ncbi:MAG TPA: superoxide dismutase family protein [Actinomycetota bacterium]|nr:superoxide dismutase family protein [Actinomycetota bacterium]